MTDIAQMNDMCYSHESCRRRSVVMRDKLYSMKNTRHIFISARQFPAFNGMNNF